MRTKIYENLAQFYTLWRETTLGQKGHEKKETKFIIDVFKQYPGKIKTVIDLGGGIGLHADLLSQAGYNVTLFDQSKKALTIAKQHHPRLKIIQGKFEQINIQKTFDAAICMWSTLSYILSEKGRQHFYAWQKSHIKKLIILDEANFYNYPHSFSKTYFGKNQYYQMKVKRTWTIKKPFLRKTKFVYTILDENSGITQTIRDCETQSYVSLNRLQGYLGPNWNQSQIYGNYSQKAVYHKTKSLRLISVFLNNQVLGQGQRHNRRGVSLKQKRTKVHKLGVRQGR